MLKPRQDMRGFKLEKWSKSFPGAFLSLLPSFLKTNLITMTPQETFDKGMVFKAEGNEAFKNQNYKEGRSLAS
jgi:hypothetical protein